ncbi:MAG: hypothetical protein ACXVZL_10795 [Gaiellaceae bacterium]
MRRIPVLLVGVAVLAGCGGGGRPAIAPAVAQRLAKQADAVAAGASAGNACAAARSAAALQTATIQAINAHQIPERYQETLQTRANELVAELRPECLPAVTAAPTAPAPVVTPTGRGHGHGPDRKHHGHGKGHD